jgi:hypothetical protein
VCFKLKEIVHRRDPKLVAKAMKSFLGTKYLNKRYCALEGFKIFGPTKKKLDFLLESKFDTFNYSF